MKALTWIDARTACETLGVKPQTLYAYVSRAQIRVKADVGDTRRSLYALADIEELLRKKRRPRAGSDIASGAIRWGDPVLETALSEVRDGMLWLRGTAVVDCARAMTLEDVTAHLLDVPCVETPNTKLVETDADIFGRAMMCLAGYAGAADPILDLPQTKRAHDTGVLLSAVANACLGVAGAGLIHERCARAWGLDHHGQQMVRIALVLLSDNELNPSTFAVRVCASTGASLPAALLAGMATLSGVRHGNTAALASAALQSAKAGRSASFLGQVSGQTPYRFGFGHPLYPHGDPRADLLLATLPSGSAEASAVRDMSNRLSMPPNIDIALAALASFLALPAHAPQAIFAVARMSGWAAHAIEQGQRDDIIRPRAAFNPA